TCLPDFSLLPRYENAYKRSYSMIILAAGMPRAGSGWHYNLTHDIVVATGGDDARQIRKRFLLAPILTEVNCNIGSLSIKRLGPVLVPAMLGNTFAIKTH